MKASSKIFARDGALAETLMATLPLSMRLALAYAPRRAFLPTLAMLALDVRLAGLLRHSREPMMAQLRLAWWRETLGQDASAWPEGEPLLAALRSWSNAHQALVPLVDGWENLTGSAPLPADMLLCMAQGRAQAFAGLAQVLGCAQAAQAAHRSGRRWALADLAAHLRHPEERAAVLTLLHEGEHAPARLPRPLRPLAVLAETAVRRSDRNPDSSALSPSALLHAMRVGIFGW